MVDEVGKFIDYKKLKFVEFLDMIVRLSEEKYIESPGLSMLEKVENTLDILFDQVNCQRV